MQPPRLAHFGSVCHVEIARGILRHLDHEAERVEVDRLEPIRPAADFIRRRDEPAREDAPMRDNHGNRSTVTTPFSRATMRQAEPISPKPNHLNRSKS